MADAFRDGEAIAGDRIVSMQEAEEEGSGAFGVTSVEAERANFITSSS